MELIVTITLFIKNIFLIRLVNKPPEINILLLFCWKAFTLFISEIQKALANIRTEQFAIQVDFKC